MSTIENQYLDGNYAPVRDELTVTDLPVEGSIPKELSGRLLRNGPNPIAPDPASYRGRGFALLERGGNVATIRLIETTNGYTGWVTARTWRLRL